MVAQGRAAFLSALTAACVFSAPAFAAEAGKPVTETPAPVSNPHKPTTGPAASLQAERPQMGTGDQDATRFGDDLWEGMGTSALRTMLEKLVPNADWPVTALLMRESLGADVPWPESDDLQALRMARLIDAAAFEPAAALYKAGSENPPDSILHSGIVALFAAGETGLACLELNAHEETKIDSGFRNAAKNFCAHLATEDETAPVPAAPLTLGAALKAPPALFLASPEHTRIPFGPGAEWNIPADLPVAAAYVLAGRDDLPLPLRLKLAARAGRADIPPGAAPDGPTPKGQEPWAQAAALYRAQGNLTPATRAEFVKKVLDLPRALPWPTRALFAKTIAETDPTGVQDLAEIRHGTGILLAADLPQANAWIARLRAISGNNPQHSFTDSALLLLGQLRGHAAATGPLPLSFSAISRDKNLRAAKIIFRITDFLDTSPGFIDTPPELYVKKLGLTQDDHYVMHWSALRDHLSDSAKKKQIGRAVLASLLVLQSRTPETIDPDTLATVLQTMVATGLKEEARQIATPVLLGVTEE